jgi:hypothetical protein
LLSQRVAGERCARPAEVARWMGAVQAQDYQQALWAIGVRTGAATTGEVEEAIAGREIVWTWPMRGTLHFVAAENARWLLELLAPRRLAADRARLRQLELDEGVIERSGRLFYDALRGGRRLPRSGMMRLLAEAGINPAGQRGYHILWHVAQQGIICLGPMRDKEQTFVLRDEWVPNARRLSREAALAELAAVYFTSHGPATVADFAQWTGLTLTDARAGHEAVRSRLVAEQLDGREYWRGDGAAGQGAEGAAGVYLLPGFDEYLLGYKDRGDVLAAEHAQKVVPGGNGVFFPILVVGGQVVGTWKRAVKKGGVAITVRPFARLEVSCECLEAAAERYSAFLGMPLASAEVASE